jgi:hypothetical protein
MSGDARNPQCSLWVCTGEVDCIERVCSVCPWGSWSFQLGLWHLMDLEIVQYCVVSFSMFLLVKAFQDVCNTGCCVRMCAGSAFSLDSPPSQRTGLESWDPPYYLDYHGSHRPLHHSFSSEKNGKIDNKRENPHNYFSKRFLGMNLYLGYNHLSRRITSSV